MEDSVQASKEYARRLTDVVAALPHAEIGQVIETLRKARADGRRVYLVGNGGSAATASHMACDLQKTIADDGNAGIRAIALSDNMPLITAIGNDQSFDEVFAVQLGRLAEPGEILIVISGSGNSPNVIRALEVAAGIGMQTIGLLGMGGGRAKDMVDASVVIDSDDYGTIEDAHMVLDHLITACLRAS